jgi:hypothetical protein
MRGQMADFLTAWNQAAPHTCNDNRRQLQHRIRAAWREERNRGTYNPPDELARDLDSLTDDDLVALCNAVWERVAAIDASDTPGNGCMAALPAKPEGLLPKEDNLVEQVLGMAESGAPAARVEKLIGKVTYPELRDWLHSEIRTRRNRDIQASPDPYDGLPDLPCGWYWVGRYQAEHPEHGKTALYNDERLLLKALRKHQPRAEKRDAPTERVQGELF